MLKSGSSLDFPRLIYLREEKFKSWSSSDGKTNIYKLDWKHKDEKHRKRHEEHSKRYKRWKDLPYIYELPEPYESWAQSLEFAIPRNYLQEIRRTSKFSLIEWGIERGFDTSIREMCLEPAISYVAVAFKLIADCIYDKETNCFYKKEDKYIASNVLLYRFWMNQTGRGCVGDHAELWELENSINSEHLKGHWKELHEEQKKFINTINEFEKENEKHYECADEEGPSIEPEKK